MAVEERQMDFRHHQCGVVRQCFHESISAIEPFNDLTPDTFQQLPVQPPCIVVGFNDQDSTCNSAAVVEQGGHRHTIRKSFIRSTSRGIRRSGHLAHQRQRCSVSIGGWFRRCCALHPHTLARAATKDYRGLNEKIAPRVGAIPDGVIPRAAPCRAPLYTCEAVLTEAAHFLADSAKLGFVIAARRRRSRPRR